MVGAAQMLATPESNRSLNSLGPGANTLRWPSDAASPTLRLGDGGEMGHDGDLTRIAADAAAKAADELKRLGYDEAWAEGATVHARVGRLTCVVRNDVRKGPPGNRERMLDTYASMVVRNLAKRLGASRR